MMIPKFFANQNIFITGGSGFIGKALVEKLLRSCPDLGNVYVLMRGKKNKSAEERLLELMNSSLFDRIRKENPDVMRKLIVVEGDCSELGLGLKPSELEKLKNVNIIYHSAASVRFDDHLRDAVILNMRGTLELVKIAEQLKHLKVFVHVSTTYCNPDKFVVEEEVYPSFADWRTTIKLAETYDTALLNICFKKYSNDQPNTYTFTKGLAEQIINEYMDKLPVVIFRPSIVVSSLLEPVPGWMDNFNGPNGLLVACGIGIMRTSHGDPDVVSDFVPADLVVRSMIVTAYYKGLELDNPNFVERIKVVNCSTSGVCPMRMGDVIESGKRLIRENPFEKTLWVPGGSITRCKVWNWIRFIFFHILTAILVDVVLRVSSRKPFLLMLQRRIFAANMALHYFMSKTWTFKSENFQELQRRVSHREIDEFGFLQYGENFDYDEFYRNGIRGAKLFLLNEPAEASSGARTRLKIFRAVDFFLQLIVGLLFTRFLIRYVYLKFLSV